MLKSFNSDFRRRTLGISILLSLNGHVRFKYALYALGDGPKHNVKGFTL